MNSDNVPLQNNATTIQTEMSFTRAEQPVVKNEIDLFGVLLNKKSVRLDFYFIGTLHKFNLPFI